MAESARVMTEVELIDAAVQGNDAALGRLLLLHEPRLERHLTLQIPPSAQHHFAAADVVQQAFVDAFCEIDQFEYRGPGSFFAWVKSIAENRLRNAIRSLKSKKRGGEFRRATARDTVSDAADLLQELAGEMATASRIASAAEAEHALHAALAVLPDDYRQVLQLRFFEEKSIQEAATAMGRSPASIRGLTDRAKAKLRDTLGRMSLYMTVQ